MTADRPAGEPTGVAARIVALRALRRVHAGGAWSVPAVHAELDRVRLDARDRSFAANLAYETLRWEGSLDWALGRVSSRPLDRVDPVVRDILRMGAWQLLYGRLPDRAAVGTAVDVTRAEVGSHVTGFVNGVLRGLARERDRLPWPSERDDAGLGLRLGYPEWMVRAARERFGDRARAVLEAGNAAPGVTLRAVLPGSRDALIAELRDAGVDATAGRHAPEAIRARGADPGRLPAVAEGRAVVQDEASMLVARATVASAVLPGRPMPVSAGSAPLILDACAGPGGKSTHLAQLGARVVATDIRPGRARMVADAAQQLAAGADGDRVHVVVADALRPAVAAGLFDAVLVDAPCTGLGVLRRRPELRWRRDAADPDRLATVQAALLEAAIELVRPGGRLVYSVCTWPEVETVGVVQRLIAVAGDRVQVEDAAILLGRSGDEGSLGAGVQLAPDRDDTDGMYVSVLRRTA